MDSLDREILSALQEDGRISVTELASRVGLSLSACHRRVRELEQSGVIEQYRAVVSPAAVGLTFEAIVFVTISRTDPDTVCANGGATLVWLDFPRKTTVPLPDDLRAACTA